MKNDDYWDVEISKYPKNLRDYVNRYKIDKKVMRLKYGPADNDTLKTIFNVFKFSFSYSTNLEHDHIIFSKLVLLMMPIAYTPLTDRVLMFRIENKELKRIGSIEMRVAYKDYYHHLIFVHSSILGELIKILDIEVTWIEYQLTKGFK